MEVGDKDIYPYIVNLAEDRDVINMLSVNRKFNDDSYFKRILEKRYPLLLEFKLEDETYKRFYLRMVKYLAKLWEEFKIPYVAVKGLNPEKRYEAAQHLRSLGYSLDDISRIKQFKIAKTLNEFLQD